LSTTCEPIRTRHNPILFCYSVTRKIRPPLRGYGDSGPGSRRQRAVLSTTTFALNIHDATNSIDWRHILDPRHHHDPSNSQELLSIGRVVQQLRMTYPSVSQSSLRFLEREGLVEPTRTPGGHRLYSPSDIDRILQIKSWQNQRLSLEEIRARLRERDRLPRPDDLSSEFLRLIVDRRLPEARSLILHADSIGMPLATTFGEVLQPCLYRIGELWAAGRLLVAQEKEASELVRDLIAALSQRHDRGCSDGPSIVAGCVQGESHELGVRMIAGLLRSRSCLVHYLGVDVAPQFFEEAVRLHHPDAVLLSVKLARNIDRLGEATNYMRKALPDGAILPIMAGGDAVFDAADKLRAWDVIPISDMDLDGMLDTVMSYLPKAPAWSDATDDPARE
jgi:DNA-binding transcriptional MerR regulator